jgi:hypothetical protein
MSHVAQLLSRAAWMDSYLLTVKRGDALSANLSPVDGMRVGHVGHREYSQALCKHAKSNKKNLTSSRNIGPSKGDSSISGTVLDSISIVLVLASQIPHRRVVTCEAPGHLWRRARGVADVQVGYVGATHCEREAMPVHLHERHACECKFQNKCHPMCQKCLIRQRHTRKAGEEGIITCAAAGLWERTPIIGDSVYPERSTKMCTPAFARASLQRKAKSRISHQ